MLHETLTANQTSQIDLNFTKILNSTSISLDINASTTRLYHITRSGGIYNDTNLCYEQPISFSP